MTATERSSGVQELIDRLREKGVEEGHAQAAALVDDARQRATTILAEARQEASELLQQARDEAANIRAAGDAALRLAARDTLLALQEEMSDLFGKQVRRLASHCLQDEPFMQRLILEIAGRAVPKESSHTLEFLLPDNVLPPEEARREMQAAREGSLCHFVLSLSSQMMREGVTFGVADDDTPGIRVKMIEEDVEISFNEEAITEFLLQHLLPRFRAIVDGSD